MATKRALTHETLVLLANNFGGMLIGLIGTVLVTRALGPEARGIYAWIFTLYSLAAAIALLTPYNIVRKLAAEDPHERNWPELLGSISALNGLATLATLPILIIALWQPLGQNHISLLILSWLNLPITVVGASLAAFLHVRNSTSRTLTSMLAIRIPTTALIVLAWYLQELTLTMAVVLNNILSFVSLLVFLAYLGIPLRQWHINRTRLHQLRHFLGASWISGITAYAMPKVPLLMLPGHASLASIGYFSLATTLLDIALMFPAAVTSVLITHFTRRGHAHGQQQVMQAMALLVGAMCIAGYILAPVLIPLIFGTTFTPAIPLFRLLLVALLFQIPLAVWSSMVVAAHQKAGIWLPPLMGLAAGVLTGALLIPSQQAYGAVMAVIASYAGQTLALAGFLRATHR